MSPPRPSAVDAPRSTLTPAPEPSASKHDATNDTADTDAATPSSPLHTWLSFGCVKLTDCSNFDRWKHATLLSHIGGHPEVPFVQATISRQAQGLGLCIPGYPKPPCLAPDPSAAPGFLQSEVESVGRIPLAEKEWCFAVLECAFTSIKAHLEGLLRGRFSEGADTGGGPTPTPTPTPTPLPPAKNLPLEAGWVHSLGARDTLTARRHEVSDCLAKSAWPQYREALAFVIVVHIYRESHLQKWFESKCCPVPSPDAVRARAAAAAADAASQNPHRDPRGWGFEVFSTAEWDHALNSLPRRGKRELLVRSASEACDAALLSLKRGIAHLSEEAAEEEEERRQEEWLQHLFSGHAGLGLGLEPDLDLSAFSLDVALPLPVAKRTRPRGQAAMKALLEALPDGKEDPAAAVNQLDYMPSFVLVRGPGPGPAPAMPRRYSPTDSAAASRSPHTARGPAQYDFTAAPSLSRKGAMPRMSSAEEGVWTT